MSLKDALDKIQEQEVSMDVKVIIQEKGKPDREIHLEATGDSKNYRKFGKSPSDDDKLIATVYVPR